LQTELERQFTVFKELWRRTEENNRIVEEEEEENQLHWGGSSLYICGTSYTFSQFALSFE